MAGEVLQFLRVLRLQAALQACTRDQVFVEYKKFLFIVDILNNNLLENTVCTHSGLLSNLSDFENS